MNLTSVTKEEFFAKIGPMNVHPQSMPEATYWKTPNQILIGISTPGWKCIGVKEYFLVQ